MSNDDLEKSLDGLIATVNYCEDNGMDDLAERAASLYQDVGSQSPEEHWTNLTEEEAEEIMAEIEEDDNE